MFVLGLVFGSFANVVIWRFPRGESLSTPGSHCPLCDAPIAWYDNIPVVSWLLLRRRCRSCHASISARYPGVELLSGGLWLVAAVVYGVSVQSAFAAAFFYLLMILSFIDLDTMRLPNPLVGLVAAIGAVGAMVAQFGGVAAVPLTPTGALASPLAAAAIGAAASAGLSLAIAAAYAGVRKAEGFGMGDVKLLGAIGLFLGLYGPMVLFFGSILGAVGGIVEARVRNKSLKSRIPFGPYLAIAAVVVAVWGASAWSWYMGIALAR